MALETKKYRPEIIQEINILYVRPYTKEDEQFAVDMNMQKCEYTWKYIPTGATGKDVVYCSMKSYFLELIKHWNRGENWKYET